MNCWKCLLSGVFYLHLIIPLYMGVRRNVEGIDAEATVEAHEQDLEI